MKLRNRILLNILMVIGFWSCKTPSMVSGYSCVFEASYVEWFSEVGIDTTMFKKSDLNCKVLYQNGDSAFVREYYCDSIFLEGSLFKGRKDGLWTGYIGSTRVIQTAYLLFTRKQRPVYVELWDIKGNNIRFIKFNTID